MEYLGRRLDPFDHGKNQRQDVAVEPTAIAGQQGTDFLGGSMDVRLADIVKFLKTNLKFKMSVITYMAYSVGPGYYTTTAVNSAGRKAKEAIMLFEEEWDLDTLNQKIGRDVWASGNAFVNTVPEDRDTGEGLAGIFMLPLSSFRGVNKDKNGKVIEFIQHWSSKSRNIPAGDIAHFCWLPLDEDWQGEGIGQALARGGAGYRTHAGKSVYRPSWFESQEMIDDVSIKMTYSGLPRYFVTFDGSDKKASKTFIETAKSEFNKLDPLKHFTTNVKGDVKTISLDTTGKFSDFIRHVDDNIITGTMSPLIRLWSNLDFTYASSQSALDAMDPLISMYRRAHGRFLENFIFRPIIRWEGANIKNADLTLTWGQPEAPTIEGIKQVIEILNSSDRFNGLYEPKKIIDLLSSVTGIDLARDRADAEGTSQEEELVDTVRLVTHLEGGRERYISTKELGRTIGRIMHTGASSARIKKLIKSHVNKQ